MKILPPTDDAIRFAAESLRRGKLIGFPTETVYGIAAAATNRDAVIETFVLKKRPAENPLIVHVGSMSQVEELVSEIPAPARRLASIFWPGPLTIVLPKAQGIPYEVTGGLDTVAIRIPRHPVALAILQATGLPLTAPSANAFMGLSPTRAEHIAPEMIAGLACVIDGGPCDVGVESTVVDCSGGRVSILRPGGVPRAVIEALLGEPTQEPGAERRSPGLYKRHYSPRTPLRLVERLDRGDAGITFAEPANDWQIRLPMEPSAYAAGLYSALFDLDRTQRGELLIELPPDDPEWEAVRDRIYKAAGIID